MKQYPILNNPITRALALLWCGMINRKKRKEIYAYGKTSEKAHFGKVTAHPGDFNNYTLIEADNGQKCGIHGEYKAFISNCTFNKLSAKTDAELKEFRRLVKLFGLHFTEIEHRNGITISRVEETFNEALFWRREQLPKGVRPLLIMENGSRVRGYWRRCGNIIELYRPNANSANTYNPLPWKLAYRMGLCYI